MENEKKAALLHVATITGKLMLITTLTALLLACVNLLTEPVISANDEAKKEAAVLDLFPDASEIVSLTETASDTYPEGINEVFTVYQAGKLIGYCVDAQAMGFGDYIGMMVGVTPDYRITGIRVLSIAETPGIGMAVAEHDYLTGYEGLSAPVTFDDGPNHADAISGATYSSRAIRNGVNLVLDYLSVLDDMSYLTESGSQSNENPAETEEAGNE
ncbi:MAG: FMN-binding protein [Ruminococcaceae bacterium]|nr:FMN-binding protein [Oscillospiraceae bacterium]